MYDTGFYRELRALIPKGILKWIDRYTYQGEELQDLIQRNPQAIRVYDIDLTNAQTVPLEINVPGRGFAVYGHINGDAKDTVYTDILVNVAINNSNGDLFPAKHQRGYRGDFYKLWLTWPAQSGYSAKLVIHLFDDRQWQAGQEAT